MVSERESVGVTLSEWEAELRTIRQTLPPTTPMRMRWRREKHRRPGGLRLEMLTGEDVHEHSVVFALYPASDSPGQRPVVEVEVDDDPAINDLPQGELVEVAGKPEAGHAALVIARGREYWPIYPCSVTIRAPRL